MPSSSGYRCSARSSVAHLRKSELEAPGLPRMKALVLTTRSSSCRMASRKEEAISVDDAANSWCECSLSSPATWVAMNAEVAMPATTSSTAATGHARPRPVPGWPAPTAPPPTCTDYYSR
jgi:hypothetical protein